jgi:hypothetical protein
MAYDECLAQRLREHFADRRDLAEKKMFGGLAFMFRGHMLIGISGEVLMARVGPEQYDSALKRPHARAMDFTGRPMKGFVYVDPPGFSTDAKLEKWIGLCLAFNAGLPAK